MSNKLNSGIHTLIKLQNNKLRLSSTFIIEEIENIDNTNSNTNSNIDIHKYILDNLKTPFKEHNSKKFNANIIYFSLKNKKQYSCKSIINTLGGGKIQLEVLSHKKNNTYHCCFLN